IGETVYVTDPNSTVTSTDVSTPSPTPTVTPSEASTTNQTSIEETVYVTDPNSTVTSTDANIVITTLTLSTSIGPSTTFIDPKHATTLQTTLTVYSSDSKSPLTTVKATSNSTIVPSSLYTVTSNVASTASQTSVGETVSATVYTNTLIENTVPTTLPVTPNNATISSLKSTLSSSNASSMTSTILNDGQSLNTTLTVPSSNAASPSTASTLTSNYVNISSTTSTFTSINAITSTDLSTVTLSNASTSSLSVALSDNAVTTSSANTPGPIPSETPAEVTVKSTVVTCVSDAVVNSIWLGNVTSHAISVSWTGINLDQQIQYTVTLVSSSTSTQNETSGTQAVFSDLTPATMYTLTIQYLSCSVKKNISIEVYTAGNVYECSTRIPGEAFLPEYTNQSSNLYKDLVTNFIMQVELNLPEHYQDLINAKEMMLVVTAVRSGSVIVDFDLISALEVNLSTSNVQLSVISALNSSALGVDLNSTYVKEADLCQQGYYTCSQYASCVREGPSYTCKCQSGFYDENPTVPGFTCLNTSTNASTTNQTSMEVTVSSTSTTNNNASIETTGLTTSPLTFSDVNTLTTTTISSDDVKTPSAPSTITLPVENTTLTVTSSESSTTSQTSMEYTVSSNSKTNNNASIEATSSMSSTATSSDVMTSSMTSTLSSSDVTSPSTTVLLSLTDAITPSGSSTDTSTEDTISSFTSSTIVGWDTSTNASTTNQTSMEMTVSSTSTTNNNASIETTGLTTSPLTFSDVNTLTTTTISSDDVKTPSAPSTIISPVKNTTLTVTSSEASTTSQTSMEYTVSSNSKTNNNASIETTSPRQSTSVDISTASTTWQDSGCEGINPGIPSTVTTTITATSSFTLSIPSSDNITPFDWLAGTSIDSTTTSTTSAVTDLTTDISSDASTTGPTSTEFTVLSNSNTNNNASVEATSSMLSTTTSSDVITSSMTSTLSSSDVTSPSTTMLLSLTDAITPSGSSTVKSTEDTISSFTSSTIVGCVSGAVVNDIWLKNVTSHAISVSWTGINLDQQIQYTVTLVSSSTSTQNETSGTQAVFSDLTPATMYTLTIQYLSCSVKKNISIEVYTAGNVYECSTRIPGKEFLPNYANQSSNLYKDFVNNFTMQVFLNLPKHYQDLIDAKQMMVVVKAVRRGSIIVDFYLITVLEVNLSTSNVQLSVISALNSSALGVDLNSTYVKEADLCQEGNYTCSQYASCVREGPSYTCKCPSGFNDGNPTVPGTTCLISSDEASTTSQTSLEMLFSSTAPADNHASIESTAPTASPTISSSATFLKTTPTVISNNTITHSAPSTSTSTDVSTPSPTPTVTPSEASTTNQTSTGETVYVTDPNSTVTSTDANIVITTLTLSTSIGPSTTFIDPKHATTLQTTLTVYSSDVKSPLTTVKATSNSTIVPSSLYTVTSNVASTASQTSVRETVSATVYTNTLIENTVPTPLPVTPNNATISSLKSTLSSSNASSMTSTILNDGQSLNTTLTVPSSNAASPSTASTLTSNYVNISSTTSTFTSINAITSTDLSTVTLNNASTSSTSLSVALSDNAVTTSSANTLGPIPSETPAEVTVKSTVVTCVSDAVVNSIWLGNITSHAISVSWTGINLDQQIQYTVTLVSSSTSTQNETSGTQAVFSDLTPATMYTLTIQYLSCSVKKNISIEVYTAGNVYECSTRIPGEAFLLDYTNKSSNLYKEFVNNFTMQVVLNLPKHYQDLIDAKQMMVVVKGVRSGSIIVDFVLITAPEDNLSTSDVQRSVISALNSSALGVDLNSTYVRATATSTTATSASITSDDTATATSTTATSASITSNVTSGVLQQSSAPAGWKVATIVLGVLLGFVLLVGIFIGIVTAIQRISFSVTSYQIYHSEQDIKVVSPDYAHGRYDNIV
ncbi:hypothetical protein UPYG_G00201180, partial [Umbra pygmaea]